MRALSELKQDKLVFYDIETAPLVKELEVGTPLYKSWEYKVNKTGDLKTEQEVIDSYADEAGLYPEFARVISIVVGKIVDDKIKLLTLDNPDEKIILDSFNKMLERNRQDKVVGFVNIGFDSPFIFKRMLINGISPHEKIDSSGLKPWEVEEIDLGVLWKGTSFSRASLINIATAFGLPSPKDEISGADVGKVYWAEGQEGLNKISKYCRGDVVTTINIFRKMLLQEPLEVDGEVVEKPSLTVIERLFNGGQYNKEDKVFLVSALKKLEEEEVEKAFVILDSMVSTAKGKKTKITKAHLRSIKKELNEK